LGSGNKDAAAAGLGEASAARLGGAILVGLGDAISVGIAEPTPATKDGTLAVEVDEALDDGNTVCEGAPTGPVK
jgi:hypothetical protein